MTEQELMEKIKIMIVRRFDSPQDAFNFFDKDHNKGLNKIELTALLKEAGVSGFIRSLAATKIIHTLDRNKDGLLQWEELEALIMRAMSR